jgi:vacuolar-type H+-ATPase subunit I/STV1
VKENPLSDAVLDINDQSQVKEVVEEARATFSLADRLKGISRRTASVTVYTDEVLGEKYGKLKEQIDSLRQLIKPIEGVVLTQEVIDQTRAEINKWQPALDAARAELEKSAFVFGLRAIPPIAEKVIARDVRKALGIKGSIPEDKIEDWVSTYNANLISQQVTSLLDTQTGTEQRSITVEEALALEQFLPKYEYAKLKSAADDLQLRNTIGELGTDSADFSQAG